MCTMSCDNSCCKTGQVRTVMRRVELVVNGSGYKRFSFFGGVVVIACQRNKAAVY